MLFFWIAIRILNCRFSCSFSFMWWVSLSVFLWCLLLLILWGVLFVLFPYIWAVCHWQWVAKNTHRHNEAANTQSVLTPFLTFMVFQKYYMSINGSSFSQEVLAFSVLVYKDTCYCLHYGELNLPIFPHSFICWSSTEWLIISNKVAFIYVYLLDFYFVLKALEWA